MTHSDYTVKVKITNYDELKLLLDKFKKEAAQLENTIEQLQNFKIDIETTT